MEASYKAHPNWPLRSISLALHDVEKGSELVLFGRVDVLSAVARYGRQRYVEPIMRKHFSYEFLELTPGQGVHETRPSTDQVEEAFRLIDDSFNEARRATSGIRQNYEVFKRLEVANDLVNRYVPAEELSNGRDDHGVARELVSDLVGSSR